MKVKLNSLNITSIAWLYAANERINLVICFKYAPHRFINISCDEFNRIKGDEVKLLDFAKNHVNDWRGSY